MEARPQVRCASFRCEALAWTDQASPQDGAWWGKCPVRRQLDELHSRPRRSRVVVLGGSRMRWTGCIRRADRGGRCGRQGLRRHARPPFEGPRTDACVRATRAPLWKKPGEIEQDGAARTGLVRGVQGSPTNAARYCVRHVRGQSARGGSALREARVSRPRRRMQIRDDSRSERRGARRQVYGLVRGFGDAPRVLGYRQAC